MPKLDLKKDTRFLWNTLAISLLVMALLFAFKPYINVDDPQLAQIQHLDRNIVSIKAADLPGIVHSPSGKPVMLVMYASWCGYCKRVMPVVVEMVQDHKLDMFESVFVSIDDQPRLLSTYLVHKGYDGAFIPYRVDRNMVNGSFGSFTSATGSHYQGAIPYIGFFGRDGKLISDASGYVSKQNVLDIVEKIQHLLN